MAFWKAYRKRISNNPHFKMSDFLRERIGNHQYKSPRADGKQDFTIDEQLISEFEELEAHQFLDEPSGKAERDCCNIYNEGSRMGVLLATKTHWHTLSRFS